LVQLTSPDGHDPANYQQPSRDVVVNDGPAPSSVPTFIFFFFFQQSPVTEGSHADTAWE